MIGSLRQRHDLLMMTLAAFLTGIGGVDSHILPASFCRFAGEFAEKCRPRSILNAFGETMVVGHAIDVQVLDADDPIHIDDLSAVLVCEILSVPGDPLMHASYRITRLAAQRSAFGQLTMLSLDFR